MIGLEYENIYRSTTIYRRIKVGPNDHLLGFNEFNEQPMSGRFVEFDNRRQSLSSIGRILQVILH